MGDQTQVCGKKTAALSSKWWRS